MNTYPHLIREKTDHIETMRKQTRSLNRTDLPVTVKKDEISELIKANLTRSQVNQPALY